MRKTIPFLFLSLIILLSPTGYSHHSFAVHFIPDEFIDITGVVTKFSFTNPHGVVFLTVKDEGGNEVAWKAETNSPNLLRRRGWNKSSVVAGDIVSIEGYPARDGTPHMRLNRLKLPDGSELTPSGQVNR